MSIFISNFLFVSGRSHNLTIRNSVFTYSMIIVAIILPPQFGSHKRDFARGQQS